MEVLLRSTVIDAKADLRFHQSFMDKGEYPGWLDKWESIFLVHILLSE